VSLETFGPVLLVGAGKMGGAMLEAWLKRGLPGASLSVLDPAPSAEITALAAGQGINLNPRSTMTPPKIAVVAVKPQAMDAVLAEVAPRIPTSCAVVSVAAGKTIANLDRHFPDGQPIIRTIPNTPAAIGRGITVCVANGNVTPDQRDGATALLEAGGDVAWIADEELMDAVTAVSGSGPAYVFLLAECLAEAGAAAGLPADLAAKLARVTVSGAGELMHRSDLDPATLRKNVTSPGGTTEAALRILMGDKGLSALMTAAVAAATKRGKELAG
jgi:pyrroline-5-carboxylate reductase